MLNAVLKIFENATEPGCLRKGKFELIDIKGILHSFNSTARRRYGLARSWWSDVMLNLVRPRYCALLLSLLAFPIAGFSQNFTVTLLGTGNPRPTVERFGPSILVQAGGQNLLFDCGRGATMRLYQLKVDRIDGLFLTHLHSDHIVGIPDLWLTGWVMGRKTPFRVWGPAGTQEMMTQLEHAYSFDIHVRRDVDQHLSPSGIEVQAKDIGQGVVYESGGVRVTAFLVEHGLVKPAFGYRLDYGGRSVVLSGDTSYSENLIHYAHGTDVLVHEVIDPAAYAALTTSDTVEERRRILAHHTTPEDAGKLFTKVAPKLAVYSHIVPPDTPTLVPQTRKTYSGPLEVGEDLMSIAIGDQVSVRRAGHSPTHR